MPDLPSQTLPEGFTGVFPFTNYTDHDFEDMWNSVKYTFPANSTVPLIIPNESPLQVQEIRKKFARTLAMKVFYETEKYKVREASAPPGEGKIPALFTDSDLAPYIQRCLEPLPMAQAKMELVQTDRTEEKLKRDARGKRVTKVVEEGVDDLQPGPVLA